MRLSDMFRYIVSVTMMSLVRGEGYWDLQLSPQSVASVPFGAGHISVWRHASDDARFYAMPLVHLLKDSARTNSNFLTGAQEMSFDVLLWSVEAKETVYRYLKSRLKPDITIDNVELLPMEKIRIVWRDHNNPLIEDFKLLDQWISNTHLPSVVSFSFTCSSAALCQQLQQGMVSSPQLFSPLELEYVINGQRAAARRIVVRGSHLTQSTLWTQLTNLPDAQLEDVRWGRSNTSLLLNLFKGASCQYLGICVCQWVTFR